MNADDESVYARKGRQVESETRNPQPGTHHSGSPANGHEPVRVLLIEDSPGDARVIREMLSEAQGVRFEVDYADRLSAGLERLDQGGIDVVLLDMSLPDSRGLETFTQTSKHAPAVPIVMLSGLEDQEVAVKSVQEGAQDYLVKGHVDSGSLARAIRYAMERKEAEERIRALNADLERRVQERTSELAEANEALARANEELRELDRMKSAFIHVTSHELRTPLVAVGGMLGVIERRLSSVEPKLMQALEAATRGARRMEDQIDSILDIAREGEYAVPLELAPMSPHELASQVVADVRPFVDLREQRLEVEVPVDLPPVPVDEHKIKDVLSNLLMNAIKFTPDGGEIRVSARLADSQTVEFRVQDTGIGIAEADRPHVFDDFFTTFDTLHHSSGQFEFEKRGIGLGLAIVKKFVEMHCGEAGVESERERGSTFWFRLPLVVAD